MKQAIPISEVCSRMRQRPTRPMYGYPLYTTYKKHYNFRNLLESLERYNVFSKDEMVCFEQALSILDCIFENGNESQKRTAVEVVSNAASRLQDPKPAKGVVSNIKKKTDDQAKKEACDILCEVLDTNAEKLRLIKNHNMLSRRFNVDPFVRETVMATNDSDEVLYELCSFVDTYKLGLDSKYKIALEECLLVMANNNIKIDEETILEAVTDYFIMTEMNSADHNGQIFDIMDKVCESSRFVTNWDYVKDLKKCCTESNISDDLTKEIISEGLTNAATGLGKKLISAFKSAPEKTPAALKAIIEKLFVLHRDEDVVNDSANLLSLIFYMVVIAGTFAIGALPGLIGLIALKTINMHLERKYFDGVMKKWYSQRDATARKIENCKDPEKKKKMEEYLKELDKNIDKLEEYSDSMRGDDEKKSDEKRPEGYTRKDDDGLGDFDFGFEENAKQAASDLEIIACGVDNISWNKDLVESTLLTAESVDKLSTSDLEYLSEFAMSYPGMLDMDKLITVTEFKEQAVLESSTDLMRYVESGCCKSVKEKLKKAKDENEIKYLEKDDTDKDVFKELNELYIHTTNINHFVSSFNELSITNNLKLAADKLMSVASNLSAKEQVASRTLDGACRLMQRSVEKALTMENREAVIRGDILPSFSKIIKLAAVTGIAALIHPALAAIVLIGRFAMSAKIRSKERQMVVDELDVELKMIDKYIADADEKKDYKKERELMLVKKKLQNQNGRLRYNLKINWNDDTVEPDLERKMKNED